MYVIKVLRSKLHPTSFILISIFIWDSRIKQWPMRKWRSLRIEWIKQTKKFNVTSDHGVHLRNIHHESELDYIRKIDHEREVNDQTSSDFLGRMSQIRWEDSRKGLKVRILLIQKIRKHQELKESKLLNENWKNYITLIWQMIISTLYIPWVSSKTVETNLWISRKEEDNNNNQILP